MNEIKGKDLATALIKKGFRLKEGGRHEIYHFFYQGKKTSVRAEVSRGSKSSYSGDLLRQVVKQMHLDRTLFSSFIECSMSEEMYADHLENIGKIKQDPQEI